MWCTNSSRAPLSSTYSRVGGVHDYAGGFALVCRCSPREGKWRARLALVRRFSHGCSEYVGGVCDAPGLSSPLCSSV
jgi:hypothetical protein